MVICSNVQLRLGITFLHILAGEIVLSQDNEVITAESIWLVQLEQKSTLPLLELLPLLVGAILTETT